MRLAEEKHVVLGGVKVHYVQAGEGSPVLLLHGLGTSLITWCRNIEPLANAGFTVLALDLPGHGDSEKPRYLKYDPVAGADLIHAFLHALGVERVSLVGSSAGGLIVSLFALDHPQEVERLVLVAPGGLGRQVSWYLRLVSLPVLGDIVYQPWLQNVIDLSKRIFYTRPDFLSDILPEMYRVRSLPGARYAALQAIRSSVNFFGLRPHRFILHQLKRLPAPLLAVWGERDNIIPPSHALLVREVLPQSLVRLIPECGHWPHMEKADEFNPLLISFLKGELGDDSRSLG